MPKDLPDTPSNSNKDKNTKKPNQTQDKKVKQPKLDDDAKAKIDKIELEGTVIQKKSNFFTRLKGNIFGSDIDSVFTYVTQEVLWPAVKNLIVEAGTQGLEQMVMGDVRSRRGSRRNSTPKHNFRYDRPSEPRNRGYSPSGPPKRNRGPNQESIEIDEIILGSKSDAERVLSRMADILDQGYDTVSLADLFDMLGLPTTYVDNQWGWFELRNAYVQQVRDGFLLNLPDPEPIPTH